jgi:hypothetical protein
MQRRPAVTLIEVLVSMFITAIGLLALLALFPVGALSMAQSIKDNRTAQASFNATAIANIKRLANDPALSAANSFGAPSGAAGQWPTGLPSLDAINNYAQTVPGQSPYVGSSYPVFIDAYGGVLGTAPGSLGSAAGQIGFPRVVPSYITPSFPAGSSALKETLKWFTLGDDLTFDLNGVPLSTNTGSLVREERYSWAYMVRLLNYKTFTFTGTPQESGLTKTSIVVYSGRPQLYLPGQENTFTSVKFDSSTNQVAVTPVAGQELPVVRAGSWILDATVVNPTLPVPALGGVMGYPEPHGFFYRVVGSTIDATSGSVILELETNPKMSSFGGTPVINYGVLVVMENVVEVIDK